MRFINSALAISLVAFAVFAGCTSGYETEDSSSSVARELTTAAIMNPVSAPRFVNLYWDSTWDADNPTLPKAKIDSITSQLIASPYMAGLAEYGVTSPSFAGGFLPSAPCALMPAPRVGFYDPFSVSISGFIECMLNLPNSGIPHGSDVVYNIIIPPNVMESDFWSTNFCTPGGADAWHFHGVPSNVFSGPPVYTMVFADPTCSPLGIFESLSHEMVEAVTDPFPVGISIVPPSGNISFTNEIADFCESSPTMLAVSGGSPVVVASYWSNAMQACMTSFCGDATCGGGETCSSCAGDCGPCPPSCGDGSCNGSESCITCPRDCGICHIVVPPFCGDFRCNAGETCRSCTVDCGPCVPVTCGNGYCDEGETCSTCLRDCGRCPPIWPLR